MRLDVNFNITMGQSWNHNKATRNQTCIKSVLLPLNLKINQVPPLNLKLTLKTLIIKECYQKKLNIHVCWWGWKNQNNFMDWSCQDLFSSPQFQIHFSYEGVRARMTLSDNPQGPFISMEGFVAHKNNIPHLDVLFALMPLLPRLQNRKIFFFPSIPELVTEMLYPLPLYWQRIPATWWNRVYKQ